MTTSNQSNQRFAAMPRFDAPMVDPTTGCVNQAWQWFFTALYQKVGGANSTVPQSTFPQQQPSGGLPITIHDSQSGNELAQMLTGITIDMPGQFNVSESPDNEGNPVFDITWVDENANLVFAGPASGGAAIPTFRDLVSADLPMSGVAAGTYGDATHVAQITVNAEGQVTDAVDIVISGGGGATTLFVGTYAGPLGPAGAGNASQGNAFTPTEAMSILAATLYAEPVAAGTYQIGIAAFNTTTKQMTSAPTFGSTYTAVGVVPEAITSTFITPFAMNAGTTYIVFLNWVSAATPGTVMTVYYNVNNHWNPKYCITGSAAYGDNTSNPPITTDTWTSLGDIFGMTLVYE